MKNKKAKIALIILSVAVISIGIIEFIMPDTQFKKSIEKELSLPETIALNIKNNHDDWERISKVRMTLFGKISDTQLKNKKCNIEIRFIGYYRDIDLVLPDSVSFNIYESDIIIKSIAQFDSIEQFRKYEKIKAKICQSVTH